MTTTLDLAGYKTSELKAVADLDPWTVRDEAYARQDAAMKQIAALDRKRARLLADIDQCGLAIMAASREIDAATA